jgi:metal-responsive CopG/Arc/MetJ family transcriptional regulator
VKTAVSIPDEVYAEAEQVAARRGVNRSELYTRALRLLLAEERGLTERINEAHTEPDEDLGTAASRDLIETGAWEW